MKLAAAVAVLVGLPVLVVQGQTMATQTDSDRRVDQEVRMLNSEELAVVETAAKAKN